MALAAPGHQETNIQFEVTWIMLRTVAHSLMVHDRFLEAYINYSLMYTKEHIFPVLQIKDVINEDGNPTTPFKPATVTKPSVSHYACYFVHMLYGKLLQTLGQRH